MPELRQLRKHIQGSKKILGELKSAAERDRRAAAQRALQARTSIGEARFAVGTADELLDYAGASFGLHATQENELSRRMGRP